MGETGRHLPDAVELLGAPHLGLQGEACKVGADARRHGIQFAHHQSGQCGLGVDRDQPEEMLIDHQRIGDRADDLVLVEPCAVVEPVILGGRAAEKRFAVDEINRRRRHPRRRFRQQARGGTEIQLSPLHVEDMDLGEVNVQVTRHRLGAWRKDLRDCPPTGQGPPHVRRECRQPGFALRRAKRLSPSLECEPDGPVEGGAIDHTLDEIVRGACPHGGPVGLDVALAGQKQDRHPAPVASRDVQEVDTRPRPDPIIHQAGVVLVPPDPLEPGLKAAHPLALVMRARHLREHLPGEQVVLPIVLDHQKPHGLDWDGGLHWGYMGNVSIVSVLMRPARARSPPPRCERSGRPGRSCLPSGRTGASGAGPARLSPRSARSGR